MPVTADSCRLQSDGRGSDRRTSSIEHVRQHPMAQPEVLPLHPVVCHQERVGTPLRHLMRRAARRRQDHLRNEGACKQLVLRSRVCKFPNGHTALVTHQPRRSTGNAALV